MRKLKAREIDELINLFDNMTEHLFYNLNNWNELPTLRGLHIIKAMLIAVWKLSIEYEASVKLTELTSFSELSEDDDYFYDDVVESMYELCGNMEFFVFPEEEFMKNHGWIETELFIDYDELHDYDASPEDIKILAEIYFGEAADALDSVKDFIYALYDDFYADYPCIMENTRVGMFMEYVDTNRNVKRTKLYKQIDKCVKEIIHPYNYHFSDLESHGVKNGCFYAFSTGGGYSWVEEYIDILHGKMFRRFYVEMLDQLLDKAEERYGYLTTQKNKNNKKRH